MSLRIRKNEFGDAKWVLGVKVLPEVWADTILFKLNDYHHSYWTWVSHVHSRGEWEQTQVLLDHCNSWVHFLTFCSLFLHLCQGNQLIEGIFFILLWILKIRNMIFDRYYFERVNCIQCPHDKVIRGIPHLVKIKRSEVIIKNFRGESWRSRRWSCSSLDM